MTIKIPTTSKRASIYLRYILYRTRHGFGLFVCLFPGSRMSGTNRLPRNYYIHLKSYRNFIKRAIAAKKKNNVRKKSVVHRITTYGQRRSFFSPCCYICSVFFSGSLNPQWYINHSSSTELRYERRPFVRVPKSSELAIFEALASKDPASFERMLTNRQSENGSHSPVFYNVIVNSTKRIVPFFGGSSYR
jgi:hypothetical protein